MKPPRTQPPIAVTGVAALFPGGNGPDDFWRTIVNGKDCLTDVPDTHWLIEDYYDADSAKPGKTYTRRGAFLSPVFFEPLEHGIPPSQAPSTDTAQLLALIVAKRLIESSCDPDFRRIDRERISVILGVASATELVSTMSGSLQRPVLEDALRESGIPEEEAANICDRFGERYVEWTESTFPGLLGNVVAGRIANRFDLGGANCVVDAACASSLGAVRMAMQELWCGAADLVITGGVDAINDIFMFMCFSKTLAMSKLGDCRPFDIRADGTMLGEGIGMFALRRLEDAERDGDRVFAVIRGIGASSDGRAKSIYAPRPEGQARALRRAYEAAGYGPATVELLEAHGTGTSAGDAAELTALGEVFTTDGPAARQWCAIGSVKSQIGHTKAAAGSASLYKAVMALHHKVLPPTIKVTEPNPALRLDQSAFYVNSRTRPWIHGKDYPRRAAVSSFGFGGSNFHLTLEEYRGSAPKPPLVLSRPTELCLVSAATEADTLRMAAELAARAHAEGFAYAARECQKAFSADAPCRLAIVARDAADLSGKIDQAKGAIGNSAGAAFPGGVFFGSGQRLEGGVAFLFPGQGSQYLGMGADLVMAFDEARRVWDEAARVHPDLPLVVFPPPAFSEADRDRQAARLTATENAQPVIGITSAVFLKLLHSAGVTPDYCAGHSFGEVSALFAAGAIREEDFLAIARERGRLMAEAARSCPGAMLAVGASAQQIATHVSPDLTLANINSPSQVVLAGTVQAVEQAAKDLAGRGFAGRRLPVSTAFHSPIVASAAPCFSDFLRTIAFDAPRIPVFANSSAQRYPDDADAVRGILGNQLASPVRFADQIEALYGAGARYFIEAGPGSVATDLTIACLEGRPHLAVSMDAKRRDGVTSFWMALARLAAAGVPLKPEFAWRDYQVEPLEAAKPSPMAIPISGANYGKKYPPRDKAQPALRRQPVQREHKPIYGADDRDRLAAIEQLHQQMAEAHATTQKAMSDAHLAYLRASEAAFAQLGASGVNMPLLDEPVSVSAPVPVPVAIREFTAAPEAVEPTVAVAPPTPPPVQDLAGLVLSIVADKTGYPREVLALDMDLESDLGIDSIKRVQILAAVRESRPDLPEVDAPTMAGLRTLGSILNHLSAPPRRMVQIPPHLAVNGLVRLGMRQVEALEEPKANAPARISHVVLAGSPRDPLLQALADALTRYGLSAIVTNDGAPDSDATIVVDSHVADEDLLLRAQRAFQAARHFGASRGPKGGIFVGVESAASVRCGLAALVKTLGLEYPACSARVIEIEAKMESLAATAEAIAREILSGASRPQVTIAKGGARRVPDEIALPIGPDRDLRLLSDNPVIVVTGGARGVTAACLAALAETAPVRLALFGRTKVEHEPADFQQAGSEAELKAAIFQAAQRRAEVLSPRDAEARARRILASREVAANLQRLRKLGAEAEYFTVDVTDGPGVAQALEAVRCKWGQVDGLIHAAGVIADKVIAEKSPEQFEHVFSTKAIGFASLLSAARPDDLRFIYVFSSVAGRYGNRGQADYAMANAAISHRARDESVRRGTRCVVRALSWGPWEGGMVTPDLRSHFAARGIPLIPMERGVAAFVHELCHTSMDLAGIDVVLAAPARSQ
jgi:acyl transferase domain-containing protein/NAD(P)-dependent dehydrogenase (short-subunit alcohol dehydrogenase family)